MQWGDTAILPTYGPTRALLLQESPPPPLWKEGFPLLEGASFPLHSAPRLAELQRDDEALPILSLYNVQFPRAPRTYGLTYLRTTYGCTIPPPPALRERQQTTTYLRSYLRPNPRTPHYTNRLMLSATRVLTYPATLDLYNSASFVAL